jgi:hypothetical protein
MSGKAQVLGMIVAVLIGFGSARASANEMQFAVWPDQSLGSYTEDGMTVTNYGGTLDFVGLHLWSSYYGALEFQDGVVVFTVAPGYTFNLNSFFYNTNGYYVNSRWIETSTSAIYYLPNVEQETLYFSGPDFTNITWFELGTGALNEATGIEFLDFDLNESATPEPGSIFLLGSGLLGLANVVRRKLSR